MNLIILGHQGSGKGTQATLIAEKYKLKHYEAGKILRSISQSDNKYAAKVAEALNSGNLVPDELVRLIAWDYINKHNQNTGFIFDGYPRSVPQFLHLEDMLKKFGKRIDMVINLEINKQESIRRLSSRRVFEKCGNIYNLINNPTPNQNCSCGGNLIQREDDKPQAISRRLDIYHQTTHPVFDLARKQGITVHIDGGQSIEKVFSQITSHIDSTILSS